MTKRTLREMFTTPYLYAYCSRFLVKDWGAQDSPADPVVGSRGGTPPFLYPTPAHSAPLAPQFGEALPPDIFL